MSEVITPRGACARGKVVGRVVVVVVVVVSTKIKVSKYSKAPDDFTVTVPDAGTKQWICKTCDNALKRGKLPAQA